MNTFPDITPLLALPAEQVSDRSCSSDIAKIGRFVADFSISGHFSNHTESFFENYEFFR